MTPLPSDLAQVPWTSDDEPVNPVEGTRLAHFPVTFFATVMGLAGLALAWLRPP